MKRRQYLNDFVYIEFDEPEEWELAHRKARNSTARFKAMDNYLRVRERVNIRRKILKKMKRNKQKPYKHSRY